MNACPHDVTTHLDRTISGHKLTLLRCSRCGCLTVAGAAYRGDPPSWIDPAATTPEGVVHGMLRLAEKAVENRQLVEDMLFGDAMGDPRWTTVGGY